ncbi:replicative DNA helicase [[Mycoplasma] gypis]|uniref:Replicative DNA helicase n=1 Tax=[Mycoplasma] gypis TaxID=92404 RepID=A0ABZ2RQ22_9BACT|nr:replicative DNA helicase [[Mycoplasma] gypis]MBN0919101.1 replicative DNA helicase [[Mycoplasma] gypis]
MDFSENEIKSIIANEIPLMGILIDDPNLYNEIADSLTEDIFYFEANQIIFRAIEELSQMHTKMDTAFLIDYLVKKKIVDKLHVLNKSGLEYLYFLLESHGFSSEIHSYLAVLIDFAKKKRLMKVISETSLDMQSSKDISSIISELQIKLINIDISDTKTQYETAKDVAQEALKTIHQRQGNQIQAGLSFGYETLDQLTLGYNPGDLIILAARPSMGKTAFALNVAANVARNKKTVLFFSLEMTNKQVLERVIGFESKVKLSKIKSGAIEPHEWEELNIAVDGISNWEMFLNDKSSLNISDLLVLCRRFAQNHKVDLVIIDYLQLISDSKTSSDNRQLEISKISRSLKQLARELGCPVLALSQLSRRVEMREDKQPMLSDLRESGAIEQDADSVLFLYRPDYYAKKVDTSEGGGDYNPAPVQNFASNTPNFEISKTHVIVAKNRNGATGSVELLFLRDINAFSEIPENNRPKF